jgi:phage replication O-like protein O
MSDKLKPNFTPVPNVFFDEIMRGLAPGAIKVLLAIFRFTYGWGKQSDRISASQLAEMTGLARQNVFRAVKQLGSLISVKRGDTTKYQANEYRLNIEIADTDLVSLRHQPSLTLRLAPSLRPSLKVDTHQRKPKKEDIEADASLTSSPISKKRKLSAPDPAQLAVFAEFYRAYPRHVDKQKALKAWLELAPDETLRAAIMASLARYCEEKAGSEQKYIKLPSTWLHARPWDDEPDGGNGDGTAPKIVRADDRSDSYILEDGTHINRGTYRRMYG